MYPPRCREEVSRDTTRRVTERRRGPSLGRQGGGRETKKLHEGAAGGQWGMGAGAEGTRDRIVNTDVGNEEVRGRGHGFSSFEDTLRSE